MQNPLIAVADSPFPSLDPAKQALAHLRPTVVMAENTSVDAILNVARDADAILVTYAQLPADLIRQLSKCQVISRMGLGVDNIDLVAAGECGVTVTYVPDYCIHEVSDHAMAMLLALARKIPLSNQLVQAGRWEMPAVVPIHRLKGRVLGLIGFGNIPRSVAPKANVFGLDVIAYDPYASDDLFADLGVERVSYEALLERSDFVSVHAPATPETVGLVNAASFKAMKNTALVINTARGPLINEPDLIAALDAGEIGGAALDVVENEPLAPNSPLLGRDNVILSPHTAFYSDESLDELQAKAASDAARVLSGEDPDYPIRAG